MNLDSLLTRTILIGKHSQPILYKGLITLGFSYGRIGHRKEACPYLVREPEGHETSPPPPPPPPLPTHDPSPEDAYGPWTLVSKRKAKPRNISPRPISKAYSPTHRQNTLSPNDHSTHQPFNACHSPRESKEGKGKAPPLLYLIQQPLTPLTSKRLDFDSVENLATSSVTPT